MLERASTRLDFSNTFSCSKRTLVLLLLSGSICPSFPFLFAGEHVLFKPHGLLFPLFLPSSTYVERSSTFPRVIQFPFLSLSIVIVSPPSFQRSSDPLVRSRFNRRRRKYWQLGYLSVFHRDGRRETVSVFSGDVSTILALQTNLGHQSLNQLSQIHCSQ